MASSNNSSLALVTSSKKNHYDVFVTFRGEDTRNNFTDFLFDALETKNISVFRDNTNLQQGESIGPELLRAIEGSQVYVAVFSRNYASSTWCLRELEKICERVHGSKKHVLPIFYDVDPSEVRKQSGIYREAFTKHEQRFQQDFEMVSRWREALEQVGSISGWDLRDKPQSGEIKKIVQKIMNILEWKPSCVSTDLVGIDSPIEALHNHLLLDSVDSVRAIGICGMGGIGKTTLVMALYDQIRHQFSATCFIDDVTNDGPLDAQKQILFQTLGIEQHKICDRYSVTDLIRRRLCREKALVILDNVNHVEQLEKIAVHRDWLGAGSRIIIISRDEQIVKEYGVDLLYRVPFLNWAEANKLFCRKAFKVEKIIMSNYQNLAEEILDYANGLPLAITVLGSFLFGRNVTEWKSALNRLRASPDRDVMDVLQLSFDGLNHMEKEIFLHIACFFNGWDKEYVKNILNCCGFHADIGLRVLIDKSLISIDILKIGMHSLLKDLGIKIVQENSSKEQRKWSRLWCKKQLYNVMRENMENHVEAIVLKYDDNEEVDAEDLSKMSNLKLLIINHDGNISGSLSCLSNKLRYVAWPVYPFKYLPSNLHPNELGELILRGSSIKQLWKNKKYLPNLRTLDLSGSKQLQKIIDFGEFPNLEWLSLERCEKLVELDPSIGLLTKLVHLNLRDCINLVKLDPSIGLLTKLVYLNIAGCIKLVSIPNSIFGLSSLEYLNMGRCSKVFNNSRNLIQRIQSVLTRNTYLLPSLHSLYCLREVDISYCHLSHVPDAIECLHWLERLNLRGNDFVRLPSLRKLSKLVYLNLQHCKLLESLPQLPSPTSIGRDHHDFKSWWSFSGITGLVIFNCPKLGERECYSSMTFSWMTQFIQENPQSYPPYFDNIQIVTPGSEMPSWINNQSMGGSIRIYRSPIKHNYNNIIGFVCCVLFVLEPKVKPWATDMKLIYGPFRCSITVPITLTRDMTKSSHLWIIYLTRPRGSQWYSYEFGEIRFDITGLGMEAKSCGYRWVCKQDLQEFNLTMMNHENSLARKCKIMAIEDETQPQRQSEQESFFSQVITTSHRRKSTSDNKSTAKTISVVNRRKQREKSRTSTETEVSVEVQDSPVADDVSSESPSNEVGTSDDSSPKSDANAGSTKAKRSRPARKSQMPPVKNEDLVPGVAFMGKVKSIQPFGAFVDFGAFKDGFVHISMLSDSYVKDVESVVSVGQEVMVKVIEVNAETKHISLSMRENVDTGIRNAQNNLEKASPGRRDSSKSGPRKDKKNTKFVVGQELQGMVKNMTRSGTFISLPKGKEGFLPLAKEDDDGFGNILGKSSLEIGQEVSVRVLHITRGQATLTMKKEGACSLVGPSTTVADDERNQGSIINGATEKETKTAAESLALEGDLEVVNSIIEEAIQIDITTSNVETDSPVEVDDESVTENGVDQIVAEDEQQSLIDNGKEDVSAATETDSDAVEPGPVITESEDDNVEAVPENNEIDASLAGQSDDFSPVGSLNKDVTEESDQVPSPESPATEEMEEEQTPVKTQVEEVAIASETNRISKSNGQTEGLSKGFHFSRSMIILFLSLPVLKLLGVWVRR